MKIVFVGIHHKTGMEALDSRSRTGIIIDKVIDRLGDHNIEKTNLFPTDYMPNEEELWSYIDDFPIDNNAVYVALGKKVDRYLQGCHHKLSVNHPGYVVRRGATAVSSYVQSVSEHITKYINKHVVQTKCVRCGSKVTATRKDNVYCDSCISVWVALH